MFLHRHFRIIVLAVVAVMGTIEVWTALGETQAWDEGIHISAGYAYLTQGSYRWNIEHPPLAKIMCALPLLALHLSMPTNGPGWKKGDEVQLGVEFLYLNRVRADSILFPARCMTILLTMLFGIALAWWMRRRFGAPAAVLALCLYAFDPNLIAHGHYVTTDVPVTVFYFLACVLWADYLESGRFRDLVIAAAAFAIAMVTKFSAVLLIPTLAVLYGVRWFQTPREFSWRRLGIALAVVSGATFLVVNVVYWPETLRCLTTNVEPLTAVVDRSTAVGKILYIAGKCFGLPAHTFFTGLSAVASHNKDGHASYLLGMRSDQGWWYYFPVVFAVKSTMATLAATALLLAAGIWLAATRVSRRVIQQARAVPFVWIALLFPPLFYFIFSMTSAINIGVRHILPVYPFLYAAAAALLVQWSARRILWFAAIGLAALQIGECASIFPDYLAFFNALSGGPGNGPHYLVDSNIDWGQDVKKLARWLHAHGTNKAWVCYFGNTSMRYYGVEDNNFPEPLDRNGWAQIDGYAVANVTVLQGVYVPLAQLAPLRLAKPIAKIGYSMYVYDFRKHHAAVH
ncbi:MAG TPA: glycosyltransferase family 39 protein [Bryobacteraceae bacterium]|nr:glycosyltransferase family 39 protein [Bryobacteraceae bacterium]